MAINNVTFKLTSPGLLSVRCVPPHRRAGSVQDSVQVNGTGFPGSALPWVFILFPLLSVGTLPQSLICSLPPPFSAPGHFTITALLQAQVTLYGQELSVLHGLGRKVTATLRFQVSSPSRHDLKSYPHLHPGLPSVKRKKPPYLASSPASPHPSLLPAPLPHSFCDSWPMCSGCTQCHENSP